MSEHTPTQTRPPVLGYRALCVRDVLTPLFVGCWLTAIAPACGGSSPVPTAVADSDLDPAIGALRFRVASNPSDMRSRAELARLQIRAGFPGAALRQFEVVREYADLDAGDRARVSQLYAERYRARLYTGDGLAYTDIEAAKKLGAAIERDAVGEAYFLAALVAFRAGHQWGRKTAAMYLARAAESVPDDARLASLAPESAELDRVGQAGIWLYRGGAMRVALEVLGTYVDRGGRDPGALRAFVATRSWWGDTRDRYRVDLQLRRELLRAGVSSCPLATAIDEVGCAGTMWSVATGPADVAIRVRARALALSWRLQPSDMDVVDIRAWTVMAIRGFLAGEAGVVEALRERVPVTRAIERGDALGYALPTLLRAAGNAEDAASSLDAMIQARPLDRLSDADRLLLAYELAVEDHPQADEVIDRMLTPLGDRSARHPQKKQPTARSHLLHDVWQIALIHARQSRDRAREQALLSHPLARATSDRGAPMPRVEAGLSRIALAYLDDPALADRRAREFVDVDVYPGVRAPAVAALFTALGDTARALSWWEKVVEIQPHHAGHTFELAAAALAVGDLQRARVHFTAASTDSGDAGAANFRAALWAQRLGHPLEAVHYCKLALAVTATGWRRPIMQVCVDAMTELGRTRDVDALRAAMRAQRSSVPLETPGSHADGHRPSVVAERPTPRDPSDPAAVIAWLEADSARASDSERQRVLERAIAWNPGRAALETAILEALPTDDELYRRLSRELWSRLAQAGLPTTAALSRHAESAREAAFSLRAGLRDRDRRLVRRMLVVFLDEP